MNPHICDISNLEQFDAASFEKIHGDHVWSMSEVKWHALRMMLGGQVDEYDYHYVGFNQQILYDFLKQAGFSDAVRVSWHSVKDFLCKNQVARNLSRHG